MTTLNQLTDTSVQGHSPSSFAIIVGAGPAGLAVGACLRRAGVPFVILEQSDRISSAWHRHYDRLHLHTNKAHSALPFRRFPRDYPRYPSRLQLIRYLEDYARHFQLEPRFGRQVTSARRVNGAWEVETPDGRYGARNLVVAAGYNRQPCVPEWPGRDVFRGPVVHSSEYRNGRAYSGQKVLVVGFGNSGGEIAIDLCEHGAETSIAVRSPVNVLPRDLLGIPIIPISIVLGRFPPRFVDAVNAPILRAVKGDLSRFGLRKSPLGPMTSIRERSRIPLIDVGTIDLIKQGKITIVPGIQRFTENGVVFDGGEHRQFDAVILATGFRPRVDEFLEDVPEAYDENGTPHASGGEAAPGLHFCGYFISPTGMLREIGKEARRISKCIARAR